MIKCGDCVFFERANEKMTYCKYHNKRYFYSSLTEKDGCSKGQRKTILPFDQALCDKKYWASVAADCYCSEDCNMECPYTKEAEVNKSQKVDLKPCPFCGKEKIDTFPLTHVVACHNCRIGTMEMPTLEQAIMVWNTRISNL